MTTRHPNRPRPKNRRPRPTPGQLILLATATTGLINAITDLLHR